MTRRRLNILLHWSFVLMLLAMIKGGTDAIWLRWVYVAVGAIWVGTAVAKGVHAKPGPKLVGVLRATFTMAHAGIYAVVTLSVLMNAGARLGLASKDAAFTSLLILLVIGTFHALFHFWRHNVLRDNALRMISPRFMHKYL
ncbi:MAG: hypothetical protein AAFQ64_18660 [Pseudomonadota bacterium]